MDLDLTLIIQLTLFVSIVGTLNVLLFKPFMRVVEKRHEKIHGMSAEASRLERLGLEEKTAYQHRMAGARAAAQQAREALVREGREEERKVVARARAEAGQALNEVRARMGHEAEGARRELHVESAVIARSLVQTVLGREVTL